MLMLRKSTFNFHLYFKYLRLEIYHKPKNFNYAARTTFTRKQR